MTWRKCSAWVRTVCSMTSGALTAFFQREAERGGAPQPAVLAQQLTVVFDGASARAVVQADALHGLAVATASALLDHAGLTAPAHRPARILAKPEKPSPHRPHQRERQRRDGHDGQAAAGGRTGPAGTTRSAVPG